MRQLMYIDFCANLGRRHGSSAKVVFQSVEEGIRLSRSRWAMSFWILTIYPYHFMVRTEVTKMFIAPRSRHARGLFP